MVLITITILTLICATSLYVTSQDATATTQTTSWQQAMAGAEAAADQAMNALNTNTWTGWYTITDGSLPVGQPSPSATPFPSGGGALPGAGQYNYYSSSFSLQGEASNSVSMWVTVDNGSVGPTPSPSQSLTNNGAQAYRIRATATVEAPGPKRVSNNKLDNDLRHISLLFNRLTGTMNTSSHGQTTRRIELVAVPVFQSFWGRAITLRSQITLSGNAYVDSFDSSNPFKSTNGQYDSAKRQSNGDIGLASTTIGSGNSIKYSDLNNSYVYGSILYSGAAIKDTQNVQGGVSTPFNALIPTTVDPIVSASGSWAAIDNLPQYSTAEQSGMPAFQTVGGVLNYTSYTTSGGKAPITSPALTFTAASTNASSPTFIKVNGDFILSGQNTFKLSKPSGSSGTSPYYVVIWVTGQFNTSGGAQVVQDPSVKATWIIDGNITTSGSSYVNQSGLAANTSFVGVGTGKTLTDSGNGNFIGTINAPGYDITISGNGAFVGALIGDTLTISGNGGFHYDQALGAGANLVANFAYGSWFEDNSDPTRGMSF